MQNPYTVEQFNADLEQPYAWPGGYPRFFLMSDGETLSFAAARENADEIREAIASGDNGGWRAVACDVNWEDEDMVCAHTGEPIECAYPSDPIDMDDFLREYAIAALWSSTDEDGAPLDESYSVEDIAPDSLAKMRADCVDFVEANMQDIREYVRRLDQSRAAHDFWLTRNRHGAGFWDRGLKDLGTRLSDAAKVYGSCDIYKGDDGKLYVA